MHYLKSAILLLLFQSSIIALGQSDEPSLVLESITQQSEEYAIKHPSEKVYLHFDKPFYIIGEEAWFKAYVLNSSDLSPTNISGVLYVDWIDPVGGLMKHQILKIENGVSANGFAIDTAFYEGSYTVRAYTNWMRNEGLFLSKSLPIFNTRNSVKNQVPESPSNKIDLQFFPEGGNLVYGFSSRLAFKAVDEKGRGVSVKGHIEDERNRPVATFQSAHKGMGVLPIKPVGKHIYTAVLDNGERYDLPKANEKGTVISVSNLKAEELTVRIQSDRTQLSYLVGRSHGQVSYAAFLEINKGISSTISIPKQKIPEGIFQLTLFDNSGKPINERQLFVKNDKQIDFDFETNKSTYEARDSVEINLDIPYFPDSTFNSFSISITDAGLVNLDDKETNIYTSLLLESDLKGYIEEPIWYFESNTASKTYALDLLMLTHGWSRYNWKDVFENTTSKSSFRPEQGIHLKGQIFSNRKPAPFAPITLVSSDSTYNDIYESDSLGGFLLSNLDFTEGTLTAWPDMSKKVFYKNPNIKIDYDLGPPPVKLAKQISPVQELKTALLVKANERLQRTGIWNLANTKMLDEVVVKGKKMVAESIGGGAVSIVPSAADLNFGSHQFIARQAKGLFVAVLRILDDGTEIWTTPAGGAINLIINGFPVDNSMLPGSMSNPLVVLNSIPIEQIERVIINGDIRNGYIISVTRNMERSNNNQSIAKVLVTGYDEIREFYHPKYGVDDTLYTQPDNRMTLYWNPNLNISKKGQTKIKFYNSDTTEKFNIEIEGFFNGRPAYLKKVMGN